MERATEIALAREILDLQSSRSAFLVDDVAKSPVVAYLDEQRFVSERDRIMRLEPQPLVHVSELSEPGDFLRRDLAGLPVLLTRDSGDTAHAFLNVCRHRGTRLVDDERGCKHRFSCPYHAWTYSNQGQLLGVPHETLGFPDMDRDAMGLTRLNCVEKHGWIWVWGSDGNLKALEDCLNDFETDLEWLQAARHKLVHQDVIDCAANWKIIVEGGIEAYHFKVAHRQTIAPYFLDNLSSFRSIGPHMRSVLAKRSITDLRDTPEDEWRLLDHAQVLLSVFPLNQFLVQSDHFAWIQLEPISATTSRITLSTLVPSDRLGSEQDLKHWRKNHEITLATLGEDFDIAESIQAGLTSGANKELIFGRFEGALAAFNAEVERRL